jgi:hypothetical protein
LGKGERALKKGSEKRESRKEDNEEGDIYREQLN